MVPSSLRSSWSDSDECQRHKLAGKGYGLLPGRQVRVPPWEEVAIDLISPWKVKVNDHVCEFNALTCIDTAHLI
ncbi:hypothetical protein ACHAXN_000106 [Cyclotella atomus]